MSDDHPDPRQLELLRPHLDALTQFFAAHKAPQFTVRQLWEKYAAAVKHRAKVWRVYETQMAHPLELLGDREATSLLPADIQKYQSDRLQQTVPRGGHPSPATLNCEVGRLVAVLNWAQRDARLIPMHNLIRVKKLKVPRKEKLSCGEEGVEMLLEATADHDVFRRIVLVRADTGARPSEIRELQWSRVDLVNRCIRFRAEDTKNGEPRVVPLIGRAFEAIRTMPRRLGSPYVFPSPWGDGKKPYSRARLQQLWRRTMVGAGLEPDGVRYSFHQLRHNFINNAEAKGLTLKQRMAMVGHKSLSAHEQYLVVTDSDLRDAREKLERGVAEDAARSRRHRDSNAVAEETEEEKNTR